MVVFLAEKEMKKSAQNNKIYNGYLFKVSCLPQVQIPVKSYWELFKRRKYCLKVKPNLKLSYINTNKGSPSFQAQSHTFFFQDADFSIWKLP